MKYKHIIFDIDGTLIDSEQPILHSLQEVLLRVTGIKHPLEDLTFCFGIPGEDTLSRLGIKDIPAVMKQWLEILQQHQDEMTLYKGIEELISCLAADGYGLGIITSKPRVLFESDFERFSVSRYFHPVVCADDTTEHKPAPGPLLKYMELSGADKNEILYIGDSIYDSQCAQNAGVDFALAVWGSHTETTPAAYYLKKPADLLAVLSS